MDLAIVLLFGGRFNVMVIARAGHGVISHRLSRTALSQLEKGTL